MAVKFQLSVVEFQEARRLKDHHPDRLVRRRMHFLFLLHKGYTHEQIADVLDLNVKTLSEWKQTALLARAQQLDVLTALNYNHYAGQPSELNAYAQLIKQDLETHPVGTIAEAAQRISSLTGIKRSATQVGDFIKRKLNWSRHKDQPLPGGKDTVEQLAQRQLTFIEQTLQPLLDQARQDPNFHVLFADGVHPVMGFHAGYTYGDKARQVRTSNGRYRYNLLGAIEAHTADFFAVEEKQYIDAVTVAELCFVLRQHYGEQARIAVVLDNAAYQRCTFAAAAAKQYHVELVFLPAYSPNLNVIERL